MRKRTGMNKSSKTSSEEQSTNAEAAQQGKSFLIKN